MTRYLLNTNHLAPLVTENHPLRKLVLERVRQGDRFAISSLSLSEFLFGMLLLPRADQNREEWADIADDFDYFDITSEDAETAAYLRVHLRHSGHQLSLEDALIAVTALRYGFTLLTTDQDFNGVAGLVRENWR